MRRRLAASAATRRWGNAVATECARLLLGLALLPAAAQADGVRCHIEYGGEFFTVDAAPTADPYAAQGRKIGRYFEFKAVFVAEPARATAVNVYTYALASGEPVLVHQAKHRPPFHAGDSRYGFTGLNFVYEPSKGSEFMYWCEWWPRGGAPPQP